MIQGSLRRAFFIEGSTTLAGSIFGLSLSQRVKLNGKPEAGWKLYLYDASTGSRVFAYKDTGLTSGQEHPWPIVADSYGTMPQFWLADGSYRVRGTSSTGSIVFFDMPSVLALGPSSGGGGGGGSSVDGALLYSTGEVIWQPVAATKTGWVRLNGRSIGSATSGASERANSDCESLFIYCWNTFSDTYCPVSTGRGASAAADWAANKYIQLLDFRGRMPCGLDDMGNTAAGRFTGVPFTLGSATTASAVGGAATHTLITSETPAHTHTASVSSDGAHTHTYTNRIGTFNARTGEDTPGGAWVGVSTYTLSSSGSHTHTITNSSTGGGGAHNNMPPFVLGTFYIKL